MSLSTDGMGYRVEAPHFVAGVVVAQDGVIVDAAPILQWTVNKPIAWFKSYCYGKKWSILPLEVVRHARLDSKKARSRRSGVL